MIRSTLFTFTKHTMGRVRRRTSTKQRSMTLVVRSFFHKCRGKLKNDSSSGRSPSHHGAVVLLPAPVEGAECGFGLTPALGAINRLRSPFHFVVVAFAYVLQNVAHLVHPAALMQHSRIHRLNGCVQDA